MPFGQFWTVLDFNMVMLTGFCAGVEYFLAMVFLLVACGFAESASHRELQNRHPIEGLLYTVNNSEAGRSLDYQQWEY